MNHAEVRVWSRDIRFLPAKAVMRALRLRPGRLDLLAGCPPCQGFSRLRTLNRSRRVNDRRNDLILDFLRFASVLRPKTLLLENVPDLARRKVFRHFEETLKSLGYNCRHEVIDASQRRRRLVMIAARRGSVSFPQRRKRRRTVHDAIGTLRQPGDSGDPLHDLPENRKRRVQNLISRIPRNGGSRSDLGPRRRLRCHRLCDGFHDVYGRMHWNDVSPTITSGCVNPSKGRFLHPWQDRCITAREAALLQGFERTYRFSLARGKYPAAELIGNAFPPPLARIHALALARHLRRSSARRAR